MDDDNQLTLSLPMNYDPGFLRDVADMVKNRTLFFLPLFGAYLAFLFGKSDYIKGANVPIWIALATVFLMSIRYISLASDLLWALEGSRLAIKIRQMPNVEWPTWQNDHIALRDLMKVIPQLAAHEYWWYKKSMLAIYVCAFIILSDVFLRDVATTLLKRLTST